MTKILTIPLDDHFVDVIDALVSTGRYGSASKVVRAGLLLLKEHEAKVTALQEALIAGEESGPPVPFDNAAFLQQMREMHAK